jgi:hypothetical protein
MTCVPCAARGRTTETDQHCCTKCRTWLHDMLTGIPAQAAEAATWTPAAGHNPGTHAYGSRPPLPVDTLDPELALIELNPGDESSAVPILEAFEMWERVIRDARNLAPYGPASYARQTGNNTAATLTEVIRFLASQFDWITTDQDFDLPEFTAHVRRASAVLRRWSTLDQAVGTRIACPTQLDDGSNCDANITVAADSDGVYCRRCGRTWTVEWLIRVAGEGADGWADMEAIVRLSGLHERTIRRWARSGKVRKRGLLFSVRDLSDLVRVEVSA